MHGREPAAALREPVDALVRAVRDRPTNLPIASIVALHEASRRAGVDVSIDTGTDTAADRTSPTAVAYVQARPPVAASVLSRREAEVARLAAEGCSNREIAKALSISLHTVKDHMHAILSKTGLASRSRLAAAWHRGEIA